METETSESTSMNFDRHLNFGFPVKMEEIEAILLNLLEFSDADDDDDDYDDNDEDEEQ